MLCAAYGVGLMFALFQQGFLTDDFKQEPLLICWEITEICRKLFLSLVGVLFPDKVLFYSTSKNSRSDHTLDHTGTDVRCNSIGDLRTVLGLA